MNVVKKFIIKKQSGFSFLYFQGFEHKGPKTEWSGYSSAAHQFESKQEAEGFLDYSDDESDWHVFEDEIYFIDEIFVKGDM